MMIISQSLYPKPLINPIREIFPDAKSVTSRSRVRPLMTAHALFTIPRRSRQSLSISPPHHRSGERGNFPKKFLLGVLGSPVLILYQNNYDNSQLMVYIIILLMKPCDVVVA